MALETAIHVENISKTYGSFRAVDNVSFEVYKGEIFAMLGPNGAGKSTTIRMILDILKPDTGKIEVLGGPLTERKKDRIGYLPEERGLYKSVSVIDMMVYLGTLKGLSSKEAKTRAMAYLTQLDLAEHAKKKVSELSKGMQQKVQFAVTVMHNPEIIIIDEPFSGLDPVNTQLIKSLLMDFKREGGAVVMSTHQMHQIEEMANRLFMINQGRQQLYGTVESVRSQHALHAVVVEGEGDWSTLNGVMRVDPHLDERNVATLFLTEGVSSDDILSQIAERDDLHIRRFELAVPNLNDIFIQVVDSNKRATV